MSVQSWPRLPYPSSCINSESYKISFVTLLQWITWETEQKIWLVHFKVHLINWWSVFHDLFWDLRFVYMDFSRHDITNPVIRRDGSSARVPEKLPSENGSWFVNFANLDKKPDISLVSWDTLPDSQTDSVFLAQSPTFHSFKKRLNGWILYNFLSGSDPQSTSEAWPSPTHGEIPSGLNLGVDLNSF